MVAMAVAGCCSHGMVTMVWLLQLQNGGCYGLWHGHGMVVVVGQGMVAAAWWLLWLWHGMVTVTMVGCSHGMVAMVWLLQLWYGGHNVVWLLLWV